MKDFSSFDGYRRAVVVHFKRFEVIDGTTPRTDAADPAGCRVWDSKYLFIQSCLLSGVEKRDH